MNFMLAGGVLQVVGYLLLPDRFIAIIIPQMVFFLGAGLMVPPAVAGALTPFPDRAGVASSLMGVVQMVSASVVAIGMGAALGVTAWPSIIVTFLSTVSAFVVFRLTTAHRAEEPAQS